MINFVWVISHIFAIVYRDNRDNGDYLVYVNEVLKKLLFSNVIILTTLRQGHTKISLCGHCN